MIERETTMSNHHSRAQEELGRAIKYDRARNNWSQFVTIESVAYVLDMIERGTTNIESSPNTHNLMSQVRMPQSNIDPGPYSVKERCNNLNDELGPGRVGTTKMSLQSG